jgi:hypothetical protein
MIRLGLGVLDSWIRGPASINTTVFIRCSQKGIFCCSIHMHSNCYNLLHSLDFQKTNLIPPFHFCCTVYPEGW